MNEIEITGFHFHAVYLFQALQGAPTFENKKLENQKFIFAMN